MHAEMCATACENGATIGIWLHRVAFNAIANIKALGRAAMCARAMSSVLVERCSAQCM